MMALQESSDNSRTGHHCRDCGLFFESSKSLEVHLQYHKENLLTKWANQAAAAAAAQADATRTDSENNNIKSRREFQNPVQAAPADSTDMKQSGAGSGPGRPSSTSSYPPASSPFTHPHTPASYSSAPSPYQNDLQRFSPSNNPGPSPSSTSFGYSNGAPEGYQLPFNAYPGNIRSPRSQHQQQQQPPGGMDLSQQFFAEAQESYLLAAANPPPAGNGDFTGTAPGGQRSASPSSSSAAFRFHTFNSSKPGGGGGGGGGGCYPLDKNGVSSSSPDGFRPQSPLQCEKCGFICDTQATLGEHVKAAHPSSPMVTYNQAASAFQAPDQFFRPDGIKAEVQDSPDILDLDSQQKVFRSAEEEAAAMHGPPSNPHSVSAMLTPWPGATKPQYPPQTQTYLASSTNPGQSYPGPTPPQPQNGPVPSANFQQRTFPSDAFPPQQSNVPNQSISNNQIPNSASPKLSNPTNSLPHSGMSSAKGDSWKSNEARRPKTYNCSACNKWFTSSGHLKRHYNTTLHKNAVKQSNQPDPATLPISSHHHPNRDPNYIHSSKTPAGMSNPPPNLPLAAKTKKAKSVSPQGDAANTPSPAPSNANEGDSSRSNDNNIYDRMYERNGPNGSYERAPLQHGFGNGSGGGGFDGGVHPAQTSAFDRTAPPGNAHSAFDQRTPPQAGFEQRTTPQQSYDPARGGAPDYDPRTPNGYAMQDLNRPGSSAEIPPSAQTYDYYRYDRLPLHNQQNSTNQVCGQSPNLQAGPSDSPSGGLPICPPSLHSLPTRSPMTTFTGENTLTESELQPQQQQQDLLTTHLYINNHTIIGNSTTEAVADSAPLPSFSNFQNSLFQHHLTAGTTTYSPFAKGYYTLLTCPDYSYQKMDGFVIKTEYVDQEYLDEVVEGDVVEEEQQEKKAMLASDEAFARQQQRCYQEAPSDASPLRLRIDTSTDASNDSQKSPTEFPTSTNVELTAPPPRRGWKKNTGSPSGRTGKAKDQSRDESSNLVTSTGSPQPPGSTTPGQKEVIKCLACDKYFNRICYLTQHNKSFHSGEKPFKCDRCGKRFHSEARARDHSKKHAGEKPHKCELCPKSFNHKTDLRRHICLHSGEKPYACDHCGKGFIRKDHMLKHEQTHRNGKRKFSGVKMAADEDALFKKVKLETG